MSLNVKRKKAQVVLFPFFGDSIGGSHVAAIRAIRCMSRNTKPIIVVFQIGALSNYLSDQLIDYEMIGASKLIKFGKTRFTILLSILYYSFFAMKYLCKNTGAIVHTNDSKMHLVWGMACAIFRVPHVWHQHSIFPTSRITSFFLDRAARIIVASRHIQVSYRGNYSQPLSLIRSPIDDTAISNFDQNRLAQRLFSPIKREIVVLSLCNLRPVKRPEYWASVVGALYQQSRRRIRVIHVGRDDGCYLRFMTRQWSSNNINVNVENVGFVNDTIPYIDRSDFLLATAKEEGLGLSLIEAMARGIPVFAVDSGGHKEIVEHGVNGSLIPADNEIEAAHMIMDVLSSLSQLERQVRNGFTTCEQFKASTFSQHIEREYDLV